MTSTRAEAGFLIETRRGLEAAEAALAAASDPLEQARLLLACGRHDEAWDRVPALLAGDLEARVQAAVVLAAVHDYPRLAPLVEDLAAAAPGHPGVRRTAYRWWFATDDLARVESALEERSGSGRADLADRLAGARLHALLLDFSAAQESYERALGEAGSEKERAWALHGLGVVLHRRRDFDGAFARLGEAIELAPLDADLVTSLGDTSIRLGSTDEAIDCFETAVRLAPYHERAHYLLGNGYARMSYRRLHQVYPEAFADADGRAALARADELQAGGATEEARALYGELAREHPGWADLAVRRGSLAFAERRYGRARRHFAAALAICPRYGRAHNGLARAIEAERTSHLVHRERYERRFAGRATPEVPGIADYVVNWTALEPRHRKAVALAVDPWRRYLPALLEAGSTHYVKPLHERLSESPGQDLLADERIQYDSRLWDDVRGVGGYHTVTGVEDVERMIWNGYNTVIHELTHQVHQVLPSELVRRIQELYRRAKERDEKTGEAFLSRYAGGSVWEYFAEGANALASPWRDRFDTREIVRERLEEKDPDLLEFVRGLMAEGDVDGAFTIARVNRGADHLRRGRHGEAVEAYRGALERSPASEQALASLIYALGVAGRAGEALEVAEESARRQPHSAALAMGRASALWLAGHGLERAIDTLRRARGRVREEERHLVDLQLGSWSWTAGDAAASRRAYETALAYQTDHPQGLWGLASALALAGEWREAWERYDEAVRHRTGVVGLRAAYARDLMRAGEPERSRCQLEAAVLLDSEDPEVLALEASWLAAAGRLPAAEEKAARALEVAPWSDSARLARAKAALAAGRAGEARRVFAPLAERLADGTPPEYVYRPEKGSYVLVHTLPAVLRSEASALASSVAPGPRGPRRSSER